MRCVAALAFCAGGFAVGAGAADAVAQARPYWRGVPYLGTFEECAGEVVTSNVSNFGLIPNRSSYIEVEYSTAGAGSCNAFLNRPPGWLEAGATSLTVGNRVCKQVLRANNVTVATWVSGSVPLCTAAEGTNGYIGGEVRYNQALASPANPRYYMQVIWNLP
jgi:hypothetical protein